MDKRGISDVISAVLLILLVIAAIGTLAFYITNFLKNDALEKEQLYFNCIKDVEIELLDVCYRGNILDIKIKNKKSVFLGDFFLVEVGFGNGSVQNIPTAYNTRVAPYETKIVSMPYYSGTTKIKVIPQIESHSILCYESAPEFLNITACENDA